MLSDFRAFLINRSAYGIDWNELGDWFEEGSTFEKEKRNLSHHLTKIKRTIDDLELWLNLHSYWRTYQVFNEHLLHLLTFIRCSMLDMKSQDLDKSRHEIDCIEQLCWSVQAPCEKLNQSRHSICLQHIVPIFSLSTKYVDYFYYIVQDLA